MFVLLFCLRQHNELKLPYFLIEHDPCRNSRRDASVYFGYFVYKKRKTKTEMK